MKVFWLESIIFMVKKTNVSLLIQDKILNKNYPSSSSTRDEINKILIWENTFTPSPLSDSYRIKLVYTKFKPPKIFVIEPQKLILAKGKEQLPHVYSTERQELCLFYPKSGSWDSKKLIANYIVPWISEWFYFYEIWVGTGEWIGGGIEHN